MLGDRPDALPLPKSLPGDRKQAVLARLLCSPQPIPAANTHRMKRLATFCLFVLLREGLWLMGARWAGRLQEDSSTWAGHHQEGVGSPVPASGGQIPAHRGTCTGVFTDPSPTSLRRDQPPPLWGRQVA